MRIELERRATPSKMLSIASPFMALALTVIAGSIIFAILGKDPFQSLYTYFVTPLVDDWLREQVLAKATPLILIAIGLSVCFRSSNWNIGAEGQYLIGGMFGSIIPVYFNGWESSFALPLIMIMGMLGGILYAMIPALLRTRFGANEILTSLMLVYIAQQIVDWVVRSPWRDPGGFGFPGTKSFNDAMALPKLFNGSSHYGVIFAVLAAILVWFMLSKTLKGFEVKVIGESPRAAGFAGFDAKKMTIFAFAVSGALAGLAGIAEVSGSYGKLDDKLSVGYGFTAIIVAFLGRLNPLGIIGAGLVLALSYIGGEEAQITLQISDKATRVFQGLLLMFVLACDTLIHYKVQFSGSNRAAKTNVKPEAT